VISEPKADALAGELSPRQVHLIRTTYQLLGERGLRQISLQQVADAAGVSKGLIFYHFKTRENLILATMRWVLSRTGERIREAMGRAETPAGKVVAMIDEIFSDPEANRRFYVAYLDLVDHAIRLDDFSRLSATFRDIVNSLYAEVVALGVAQGAFLAHDVEEAARTLRAIVDGLFLQWIQEPDRDRAHAPYREAAKRAVLAYLHAPPEGAGTPAHA
jgi:AcrR family transcriptional regulator